MNAMRDGKEKLYAKDVSEDINACDPKFRETFLELMRGIPVFNVMYVDRVEHVWEYTHMVDGEPVKLSGIIDRVDIEAMGDVIRVIDYKTGSWRDPMPDRNVQVICYMVAAKHMWPDAHDIFAELWYTTLGKIDRVELTQDKVDYLGNVIETTWKGIRSQQFDAKPGDACKWCLYRDQCGDYQRYLQDEEPHALDCDDNIALMVAERQRLNTLAKLADQARKDLDGKIKSEMGSLETLTAGDCVVRRKKRLMKKYEPDVVKHLADMLEMSVSELSNKICSVSSQKLKALVSGHGGAEELVKEFERETSYEYLDIRAKARPKSSGESS